MKKIILFSLFIFLNNTYSQNFVLLDTVNKEYNTNLIDIYQSRVTEQQAVFKKKISDKKTRTEVESAYKEVSIDFIENVNKGFFANNANYNKLFDDLLDKIQKSNPQYNHLANTKILLSFGKTANAYAIGNDIVVVLIPLIKNIQNEYQLAFIICHEIAHNILEHSYGDLIDYATLKHSNEIRKKTREVERTKYNKSKIASGLYKDIVYGKRKNNRNLEHQADSLGFILFQNTFKGKENQVLNTLMILKDLDKEIDSLTLNNYKSLFETDKFPFKDEWINNNEISNYKYDKSSKFWEVDSLKTHPECDLRAEFLQRHFKIENLKNSYESEQFTKIQQSSKYNHVLGLFVIEEYGKSLYEALLILKDEPNDIFLKTMVYKNLVKLQKAQNSYTLNKYLDNISPNYSKSYNTFLYFFRQIRKTQLNTYINKYEA